MGGLTDNELSELEDETGGGTTLKRPPMPRRRTQGSDNSTPQSPSALRTQDVTQRFGLESTAESRPTPPGRRVSYAFSASQASTPGDEVDKSSTFDSELQTAREAEQQDVAAHETAEEAEPDSDGDTSRGGPPGEVDDPGDDDSEEEDVEYTLKDRQDAINIEHPFGLPIWKPALYKKSRSVTRNADANLHLAPSSQAEHHLAPGNIVWTLLFGLWLALACIIVSAILWLVPWGGSKYGRVVFELGVYLFWPFGRYVEGWDQDAIVTTQDGHTQVIHALGGATAPTTPSRPHSIQTAQDSSAFSEADSGYNDSDGESLDLEADGSPFKGGVQTLLERERMGGRRVSESSAGHGTIRLRPQMEDDTTPPASRSEGQPFAQQQQTGYGTTEETSRQGSGSTTAVQDDYNLSDAGTMSPDMAVAGGFRVRALGRLSYWLVFYLIVAPAMLFICLICWFSVFTIPMAKLLWVLVRHLHREPLAMHFRSAPKYHHPATQDEPIRPPPPLKAGQFAPKHSPKVYEADRGAGRLVGPKSKIILCTYKAFGMQYYKYTVDGVNIIFVNLIPVIFFTIFCDFVLRRGTEEHGEYKNGLLAFISNQATIFVFGLASVIPLSYFIGMAVASISAQSSIGMGAVINATFGSIIEIILYSIALSQGKANLVEGSIIGSLIAGVLLMPGGSMISGAFRRKEQRFNARSAGVTSTMLIMAIIGTLTPTLFYEIYGTVRLFFQRTLPGRLSDLRLQFQLTCEGCPDTQTPGGVSCARCSYEHIDPADDPFYKGTVRYLSYVCASILVLVSSLRRASSQETTDY